MINEQVRDKWLYPGFTFSPSSMEEFQLMSFIIINEIFKPLIENEIKKTGYKYWRFHARNLDSTNVKLILYTKEDNLEGLKTLLEKKALEINRKLPKQVTFADCKDQREAEHYKIYGSSTPGWPPELKEVFHIYIQGVCKTYLKLIEETEKSCSAQEKEQDFIKYYTQLFNKVNSIWYYNGWHAFCHHLGASFLYVPTVFKGNFPVNL